MVRARKTRFVCYTPFGTISSLIIRLLPLPGIGSGSPGGGRGGVVVVERGGGGGGSGGCLHGEFVFCFQAEGAGRELILCLLFPDGPQDTEASYAADQ